MISVGLDVGTGFVKCVSDSGKVRFPSLYAYRIPNEWELQKNKVEGIGDEAAKMLGDPGTIALSPVMHGRPVNEAAFGKLVQEAVRLSCEKRDALSDRQDELAIAVGLPYNASSSCGAVQRLVSRLLRPRACDVVPQALGTLVDASLEDGIIVSIGQGTTEIVAFACNKAVSGRSLHHAVGYISSRLGGEYSYIDTSIFSAKAASRLVQALADLILNKVESVRQDHRRLPVIISGGGILVPGMKQALGSKLDFTTPDDPVMSNASGLYKIASWYADQGKC